MQESSLFVTFCGAARTVTGSLYYLEYTAPNGSKLHFSLDAGMFQVGQKVNLFRINSFLKFDPKKLDCIVLTHAHLDHCGRIPYLVKMGFGGKIYSTPATKEIAQVVMEDAARIHSADQNNPQFFFDAKGMTPQELGYQKPENHTAKLNQSYNSFQNNHEFAQHIDSPTEKIEHILDQNNGQLKLYSQQDVVTAMERFVNFDYHQPFTIHENLQVQFFDAGHILGSAYVIFTELSTGRKIAFSGDLGNPDKPIIEDPEIPHPQHNLTHIFCETTYGDRVHGQLKPKERLQEIVKKTLIKNGKVIIPSFSVERAQEIIYFLVELMREGKIEHVPIYLDSPMASKVLEICLEHPELYDDQMIAKVATKTNPLRDKNLKILTTAFDSKSINHNHGKCILIAGSGMLNGGRILKHLQFNIENEQNTLLFVGYQAEGTLGRQILEGAKNVTIEHREFEVKCNIELISEFSGHGDKIMLKKWATSLLEQAASPTLFLMHGEKEAALSFGEEITAATAHHVKTYWPHFGEKIALW